MTVPRKISLKIKKPSKAKTPPVSTDYDPQYFIRMMRIDPTSKVYSCKACGLSFDESVVTAGGGCHCLYHVPCGSRFVDKTPSAKVIGRCGNQKHCSKCCDCWICRGCKHIFATSTSPITGRIIKGFHQFCQSCNKCCKCRYCNNCDRLVSYPCSCGVSTQHHPECCDNDARINHVANHPLFIYRKPKFHEGTDFHINRCRRFLAVETEVLRYQHGLQLVSFNKLMKEWGCGVVQEGTVPEGFEVNYAPASGDAFIKEAADITNALKAIGAESNIRCGMHVHVDARDFRYVDLVNLIYLYDKIEPALFAMLPPWRRVSRFATPCRDRLMKIAMNGEKLVESVRDIEGAQYYQKLRENHKKKTSISMRLCDRLYGARSLKNVKKTHKNTANQAARYMALNLHSWVFQRTIEFRHWPGALDFETVSLWPQICGSILDAAKRLPITDKRWRHPSISKLSNNPVEALLEILKPSSKTSGYLQRFVEKMIKTWSPDFNAWYPVSQTENRESVTPFRSESHDDLVLSFDTNNMYYTYINHDYRSNWEVEWDHPSRCRGRYAEASDLYAIPDQKLLWVSPPGAAPPPPPKPVLVRAPIVADAFTTTIERT